MKRVDLFADGNHRGRPYTEAEIDEIIANFDRFGPKGLNLLTPPIVLGHEENQAALEKFLDRTDLPAAGVVSRLYKETIEENGKPVVHLFADVADMPQPVAGLVASKAYRKVSIEHYDADRPFDAGDGKQYPNLILRRVALLGGEIPQVKQLADLPVPVFSYADKIVNVWKLPANGHCFAFAEKPTMKLDTKKLFAKTKWAKCFADGVDRGMLEEKLKPMFPGVSDWSGFDDTQLTVLALGTTAAPAPPEGDPTALADFDRAKAIADLVAAGEDAAMMEAKSDDELKAMHSTLTGTQYKDKPVATPNPTPAVAAAFAEQQATLTRLKAATAESEAAAKRATERAKQARKEDVASFCDRLVREGRLIPADREIFEPQLIEANDVEPCHKFADDTVTAYEKLRRQLAARPVIVKFGEKIVDSKDRGASEEKKVQAFAEANAEAIKRTGKSPEQFVHAFSEVRKKDPSMTARKYGIPAEYCA